MFEDTKTITLRKPVTLGKGDASMTYTEITLSEPTAGDIAASQAGAPTETDVLINLVAKVGKLPRKAVEGFCRRDFNECADFLGSISDDGVEGDGMLPAGEA